jgi:hypothetical protein
MSINTTSDARIVGGAHGHDLMIAAHGGCCVCGCQIVLPHMQVELQEMLNSTIWWTRLAFEKWFPTPADGRADT